MSGPSLPTGDRLVADRMARAALLRVSEPGDPRLAREVAAHGAAEVWVGSRHRTLTSTRRVS